MKKAAPRRIRPRRGKLWRVTGDDAAQVERAKRDLLEKVVDPYYFEALQEIRREAPHLLRGLVGPGPKERGALARRLQYGEKERPRRPRGRPRAKDQTSLDADFTQLVERGLAKNTTDAARKLLKVMFPNESAKKIAGAAKIVGQKLYEQRRRTRARKDDLEK